MVYMRDESLTLVDAPQSEAYGCSWRTKLVHIRSPATGGNAADDRAPSTELRRYRVTPLVAEPTITSPVLAPSRFVSTTWIMFTVMPLVVTPSPVGICSFSTT